ncbi:hypothetical protein W02_34000 [Nitrospira sp. KM1]|uniref:hypothetical protein n=1 Tax=Nitrospira sp. KM1 TaxID=1936990 RepID=UPI0013A73849|nr:hypothetical protein [Nitrospira sp. KM1]BCA56260.1 hypothetical protein W02_34000 [Nitrospira sp. KM1]
MIPPWVSCRVLSRLVVPAICAVILSTMSCSKLVYQPAAVVPTKSPLPYSAKIKLTQVEAYLVEPGSTMIADPNIDNHVTRITDTVAPGQKDWEKSVSDYLAARQTFSYLSLDSQTDLDLVMRLNIYIDPGLSFQFNHVYLARVETALVSPQTGQPLTYLGLGKSSGDVSRGGKSDDREPINHAVQSALNDLFGKLERDPRLRLY